VQVEREVSVLDQQSKAASAQEKHQSGPVFLRAILPHLLESRIKTKSKPLALIDDGRIKRFSCHGEALRTIPNAISKLNVVWATKQLKKIKKRKEEKDIISWCETHS
jgi:hypothetical protein